MAHRLSEQRALEASRLRRLSARLSDLGDRLPLLPVVGLFGALIVGGVGLGYATGHYTVDENTGCSPSDRTWSRAVVTYELEAVPRELGTPESAHITIRTERGTEQVDIGLPLTAYAGESGAEFCAGARALLDARAPGAQGQLRCRIKVDDEVKLERTGPADAGVRCDLTVP